jgi:mono/diheme cytochrome c family protein
VNAPLWSDNAAKTRWMTVPNDGAPYGTGEAVTFTNNGPWAFPIGTVFVKHFELPIDDTNPAVRKRLETRFLVHASDGIYYGLTYKWRADNSEADLLPGSLSEPITITTATGTRTQTWSYPSRQDCIVCHNPNGGSVLGVRTCQINGDFTYPASGVTDNQLRTLSHIGLFTGALNEANIPSLPKSASIHDQTATLELRVRSYLDANCAHCHRPGGVRANFDARLETPLHLPGADSGRSLRPARHRRRPAHRAERREQVADSAPRQSGGHESNASVGEEPRRSRLHQHPQPVDR